MNILILEDEAALRKQEKKLLEENGFTVDEAVKGEDAILLATITDYDCIILDLNLRKENGLEIAKKIKELDFDTPTILVVENSVEDLDIGGVDYISKPFEMSELLEKVRYVIKNPPSTREEVLQLEDMEIYPERCLTKIDGEDVYLTELENKLFVYLVRNKGRVVSTEELIKNVWKGTIDRSSGVIKRYIQIVREKVDPKKEIIKNIIGEGYTIN